MENNVVAATPIQTTPAMLLNIAIEKGAELDKLEKLMDLQMRWEANNAKKAYHQAMTQFKANPPDIDKNRHVKYQTSKGTTEYDHADLFNVTEKINTELSKYGLSASWTTAQLEKQISVTCRITHILGHSESTTLSSSPDDSGGKNSIQAIGSAVTYLQRYTLLALTGLATREQDNDGKSDDIKYISDKQKSTLVDMIQATETKEVQFLKYMNAESLDKILATDFDKAMTALRSKVKK